MDDEMLWIYALGVIAIALNIVLKIVLPFIYWAVPEEKLPGVLLSLKRRRDRRYAANSEYSAARHERAREYYNEKWVHDPEDDDDSCAVCESRAVHLIEAGVYKCRECGHVGGSGYADYAKRKLEEKLMSEPMHKRRAKARDLLRDVGLSLSALEGNVDEALKFSKWDTNKMLDDSVLDDYGEIEKREQLYMIQEQLLRVHDELRRAGLLLGEDLSGLEIDADTTFMLSEIRDRWTKQTSGYVRRHEHAIQECIEALAADVRQKKQLIARKRAEVGARPASRGPQW